MPVGELVDPSKVRCSGPGLGSGVRARVPQTFTVDTSKAGLAPLGVVLYGPTGKRRERDTHTHIDIYLPLHTNQIAFIGCEVLRF